MKKPIASIIFSGKRLTAFPLRQESQPSPFLFNIVVAHQWHMEGNERTKTISICSRHVLYKK